MLSLLASFLLFTSAYAKLKDLGDPGYTCDASLMAPSKVKPTNVNSLRPADINVVMALGDSLTVGI
jgi:phospholipase B1, membrane-associated